MRQIYKRLLTTLVLISATQTSSVVQAEGIRLVGPSGEVQSSPSYAEEIERALPAPPANSQPSRFIGPTGENQTLWSIASQVRPSRNVTVQQTLLAIYRLNPQAFENQNIHELIPGSRLRLPSLEQVQSASTEQAVAIMKAHEEKLKQAKPVSQPASVQRVEQPPTPKVNQEPVAPQPKVATPEEVKQVKSIEPATPVPPVKTSPQGEQQVTELKSKLQGSQSDLTSLEEKNHRLRLMLSEVQSEVETLKSELNDEERIRSEVERLLAEERQRVDEQQRMQPTALDNFLSNGWLVGLAALIPGALLAFLVVMLLGRRNKEQQEPAAQTPSPSVDPLAAPIGLAAADELEEELNLDDDLFAEDESDIISDKERGSESEHDVFAGLEDEDLDFNLEGDDGEDPFAGIGDNGDLDVGFDEFDSSSSGIKVNGEEKALGLEEMERALDEASPDLEVLDEPDFDLADDENEELEREDAFAERLADTTSDDKTGSAQIDQATLDELFAELDSDDLDLGADSSAVSENDFTVGEASDDEVDNLLAQYEQSEAQSPDLAAESLLESDEQESETKAEEADDSTFDLSDSSTDIDENSTDLLDELIDFDDEESEDEFDPLNELESLSGFGDEEFEELDADSVDLLDELLDDDVNLELEDEAADELDPFDELIGADEAPESELNQQEEDDLLASLGFDDLDDSPSESAQEEPLSNQPTQSEPEQSRESDIELESDLDIDALLNEHQPDLMQESETQDSAEQQSDAPVSEELPEDIEDISLEYDPLMRELDELFASSHDDINSAEEGDKEASSDVDSLSDEQEKSVNAESIDQTEPSEQGEEVAPEEVLEEPVVEASPASEEEKEEPEFTPTPNTVENEFGVPQEEDWLLDDVTPEPEIKQEQESVTATCDESDEDEFVYDELELPEFSEEDALASMAEEPEWGQTENEVVEPDPEEDTVSFDDSELPEFTEEDALSSTSDSTELDAEPSTSAKMTLKSDNDHDALFELFAQQSGFDAEPEPTQAIQEPEPTQAIQEPDMTGLAESDMESLLSEEGESEAFEGQLDRDAIDSAGMDFEAMFDVGDDWEGFKKPTEHTESRVEDVPEDQRDIWDSKEALSQPAIAEENWEQQTTLDDFDPKKNQFMTIDELMAQVDGESGEFEEEDLNLDVGLNEFPDVIGDITDGDVDSDSEGAGKLDLAKIYLEMNDPKGAIKLLEEAIVFGEDDVRREAKSLIDTINGR
ncbi:FimV/HubP family polar landmark protein [Vibrio sp. EA2]|uniref:FimV/HubP family polar landmark protein n=1 Tax=Vibrio sp. EA2 TaxID=3079860 RepID=UPI00294957F4|nr:FimV/HubP family polar landmark protein [Vibrio sp. EA2]MDV6251581.1 FimV/HubP family polar landmark protein [Vibrio sp. EA2]